MCGIGGVVGWTDASIAAKLDEMLIRLAHRGPDDRGVHVDESARVALCATRLAIRDVSPRGRQPMTGPSGSTIVFNGELYNADALRSELRRLGRHFAGGSDTEVALAAFERWSGGAWAKLRGMFGLAVWDPGGRDLWLVRDPLGIKPLYLHHRGSYLVFGSELATVSAAMESPRQLEPAALQAFLATGAAEEPMTMLAGVRMLPPGTAARFNAGGLCETTFWSVGDAFATGGLPMERVEAVGALREVLRRVVRSQMVSDVPIGVFLSGGIDSSTLVGLAAEAGHTPRTVSVVFGEEGFTEAAYIDAVRRRYGTEHHQIELTGEDFLSRLPSALEAMDQPTVDGVNTFVVSQVAREAGLTVVLSGMGGDELFAGYRLFRTIPRLERLRRLLRPLPPAAARPLARAAFGRSDRARKLGGWLAGETTSAYVLQRELLDDSSRRELLVAPSRAPRQESGHDVNAISQLELTHHMRNVLLRDADVMSMAHGLELRVPMLDQDVVELVGRIPSRYKLSSGREKPLLVDAVADLLPPEVTARRKMGFNLPFDDWLRGPLRAGVRDTLLDPSFGGQIGDCLDHVAVNRQWEAFERGETSWSRPWAIYVAKIWGERRLYGTLCPSTSVDGVR